MRKTSGLLLALAVASSAGCGGGSSGTRPEDDGRWRPPAGATPPTGNYLFLESEAGDQVGGGETRLYTQEDAWFYVGGSVYGVAVSVAGAQSWWGGFAPGLSPDRLATGYHAVVGGATASTDRPATLGWRGAAAPCTGATGWFTVDALTVAAGSLEVAAIDLRFSQRCPGAAGTLHGQLHWSAAEAAVASGPGTTPPATAWVPAPGATPPAGNYVHLESDPGDPIGGGLDRTYTPADARISVHASGDRVWVKVTGDRAWTGSFQLAGSPGRLQAGYYGDAQHYDLQEEGRSAVGWMGDGDVWSLVTGAIGWLAVDGVTYQDGVLTSIDLRFEQHFQGAAAALRGQVHWEGPWQAPASAVPAAGTYAYFESDPGEWCGDGRIDLYTPDSAHVAVEADGDTVEVRIARAQEWWRGTLRTTGPAGRLEPGYYSAYQPDAAGEPAAGSTDWGHGWWELGRGNSSTAGWVIVDRVEYDGDRLAAIDLRFEQMRWIEAAALHGQLHWAAAEAWPDGLWAPAPGATPAAGNYVYLESQPGDPIGGGRTLTFTEASGLVSLHDQVNWLSVDVAADQRWRADFVVSAFLRLFGPGYYGALPAVRFDDAFLTSLDWVRDGEACVALTGWYAVDRAEYTASDLTALDLRFEQRCLGAAGALRGRIHWADAETVPPSGPVVPSPPSLWRPPAGVVPSSGSSVYLESDPGDFIGQGERRLYTPDTSELSVSATGGVLQVTVGGDGGWIGNFQVMKAIDQLRPGYYGGVERWQMWAQPVRGAMDWSGHYRGCNALTGWFAVDRATYVGGALTGIDLRFEQHCENGRPSLRGALHYDAP